MARNGSETVGIPLHEWLAMQTTQKADATIFVLCGIKLVELKICVERRENDASVSTVCQVLAVDFEPVSECKPQKLSLYNRVPAQEDLVNLLKRTLQEAGVYEEDMVRVSEWYMEQHRRLVARRLMAITQNSRKEE